MLYLFLACMISIPQSFSTHVIPFGPVAERLEGAIQPRKYSKSCYIDDEAISARATR